MFLDDGIPELGWAALEGRREFRVTKYRSSGFLEGFHSLTLDGEGMNICPRPISSRRGAEPGLETIGRAVP